MRSRQSDRIEERPTLEQLLNRLDLLQTQRLLQKLVENRPELIDDGDGQFLALTQAFRKRLDELRMFSEQILGGIPQWKTKLQTAPIALGNNAR